MFQAKVYESSKLIKKPLSFENQQLYEESINEKNKSLNDSLNLLKNDIKIIIDNFKKPNKVNSLIVSGDVALAKTSTTRQVLDQAKIPYAYMRGTTKSIGDLYKLLYVNSIESKKLIVIDDSDSLIKDISSNKFVSYLISCCDTGRNRRISYLNNFDKDIRSSNNLKGKYPQNFIFNSSLIIITNLKVNKISKALRSRSIINIIEKSKQSVLMAIEESIEDYYKDIPLEKKLVTLKFLKDFSSIIDNLNLRVYSFCLNYFASLEEKEAKLICLKKLKQGAI